MIKRFSDKPVAALGLLAALIYNLWPLGYLVNPNAARSSLASTLEATHQPYNWLFVGSDVVCGLLVLLAVWLLFKNNKTQQSALFVLGGLVAFGVMTAVSALMPLNCSANLATCGYGSGQTFGVHDLTGAVAAFGIFVAMAMAIGSFQQQRKLARWNIGLLIVWSLWGLCFLFVTLKSNQQPPQLHSLLIPSQQVFLILSGLSVWLVAYGLEKTQRHA